MMIPDWAKYGNDFFPQNWLSCPGSVGNSPFLLFPKWLEMKDLYLPSPQPSPGGRGGGSGCALPTGKGRRPVIPAHAGIQANRLSLHRPGCLPHPWRGPLLGGDLQDQNIFRRNYTNMMDSVNIKSIRESRCTGSQDTAKQRHHRNQESIPE